MRAAPLLLSVPLGLLLAACADEQEPENVQAAAAEMEQRIENRAAELERESANVTDAEIARIENEMGALANQAEATRNQAP